MGTIFKALQKSDQTIGQKNRKKASVKSAAKDQPRTMLEAKQAGYHREHGDLILSAFKLVPDRNDFFPEEYLIKQQAP